MRTARYCARLRILQRQMFHARVADARVSGFLRRAVMNTIAILTGFCLVCVDRCSRVIPDFREFFAADLGTPDGFHS